MSIKAYQALYPDYVLNQGHVNKWKINEIEKCKLTIAPIIDSDWGYSRRDVPFQRTLKTYTQGWFQETRQYA